MDWLKIRNEGKACTKTIFPYDLKLKKTVTGFIHNEMFHYEDDRRRTFSLYLRLPWLEDKS